MPTSEVAISIDRTLFMKIDDLVRQKVFPNRSKAIQAAVEEKLKRYEKNRLAKECAKLDPDFAQTPAEEGLPAEVAKWPEYCGEMLGGLIRIRRAGILDDHSGVADHRSFCP